MSELRVCALYPDQMNIYADRGNILFLQRRCEWRGIGFTYAGAGPGEPVDPGRPRPLLRRRRPGPRPAHGRRGHGRDQARGDGRGGRRRRSRCSRSAAATSSSATAMPARGRADSRPRDRRPRDGPRTRRAADRQRRDRGRTRRAPRDVLAGFENHGGRTYLGEGATPLGRVISGHGNNGRDGWEGVRRDNLIGTYLHGPLLPKNAWLADHLIRTALARRYGAAPDLEPLDDELEAAAHETARRRQPASARSSRSRPRRASCRRGTRPRRTGPAGRRRRAVGRSCRPASP